MQLPQRLTEKSIETWVDKLEVVDSYTATAPILANAMLGSLNQNKPEYIKRYTVTRDKMLNALSSLDANPESHPEWMRNSGFKAWMWGVITLAADIIKDDATINLAKQKQAFFLAQQTEKENLSFFTWAWGFRAGLNQMEYKTSYDNIKKGAEQLTSIYQNLKTKSTESDALWAWIMNLFAAARTDNRNDYNYFKNKIMNVANTKSITEALITGLLLRSTELDHFQSNDFPALALAMVGYAAAIIEDQEIFAEVLKAIQAPLVDSQQTSADADYILAILYLQLALSNVK